MTPENFQLTTNQRFADNEVMKIRPADFRAFGQDIRATFVPQQAPNVPAYDLNYFYPEDYLVVFDGLYYRTKQEGYLPAPTPGQETTEWKPDLKPLSPVLPYRELSAQQGQAEGSHGLLEPGNLYRFSGRVDAQGDALDDVLVAAVSRYHVAEADAYAIGRDPQTQQEYLRPVSYELATDATAPRAAGAGGAVDAYSRDEADVLLATKASKQDVADIVGAAPAALDTLAEIADQLAGDEVGAAAMLARLQQHSLQLATLGVQASPVMAYLESGEVAGYATLDEALADTRPKTFMRFNVAFLTLTKSNNPLNPGWAAYVDGAGATLLLGAGVVLSIPGSSLGTLLFKNFFIFQAPGTRGGRVKLLATGNTSTPPGLLPQLDGQCAVPLELSGGVVALRGAYGSLLGTGTAHLFEPYDAGSVGPSVTLIKHEAGAGGPGYTDEQAQAAAAAQLLAAQQNGVRITQDVTTKQLTIENTVPVYGRLYFNSPRPGTGNLVRSNFSLTPAEEAAYGWAADSNVDRVEMSSAGSLFSDTLAKFKALNFSLLGGQEYYLVLTPIDVNAPASLTLKRL